VYVFRFLISIVGAAALATTVSAQSWEHDPFSGNWQIEAGRDGEGLISLHRPATLICLQQEPGGCLYEWQYDNSSVEMVVGTRDRSLINHATIVSQAISDGSMNFLRGNPSPQTQVNLVADGNDYFDGEWERGDQNGLEIWRRLEPKVTHIGTSSIGLHPYAQLENWYPVGETPIISTAGPYTPNIWRLENKSRGNRPVFRLFIAGDNLWGFQDVSFPDAVDYEVFTQGDLAPFADSSEYEPPPGRWFRVVLWANATPGLKTLRINGEDFKVFVDIPGFPEPADPVPLTPVRVSLGFTGLGRAEATVPVALAFTGLGSMQDTIPVSLSFQGLGSVSDPINAEISFAGLGWAGDTIETSVGFDGLGADTQPATITLSFDGLAQSEITPSAVISFQGVGSAAVPSRADIAFTGVGGGASIASVSLQFRGLAE